MTTEHPPIPDVTRGAGWDELMAARNEGAELAQVYARALEVIAKSLWREWTCDMAVDQLPQPNEDGVAGGRGDEKHLTRQPMVWPVGSPEPHDVDKVRGTNGVTFEACRFSSGFQRWTAQPPGGDGRHYHWCQMNWDERGGPGRGMELTEILDTEKNSLNEAVQ